MVSVLINKTYKCNIISFFCGGGSCLSYFYPMAFSHCPKLWKPLILTLDFFKSRFFFNYLLHHNPTVSALLPSAPTEGQVRDPSSGLILSPGERQAWVREPAGV